MRDLLARGDLVLMEAAVVERLRRAAGVHLHPTLVNAPLIYDAAGRNALARIYKDYIDIACAAGRPFLMCTPTWRADRARVFDADVPRSINADAVSFMRETRDAQSGAGATIRIGGMVGCKNDCYRPAEGLSTPEAEQFHAWQIEELAGAGVDFLIAETLPNVAEAEGIARAMQATGVPYIISFVISREGSVLDGTGLAEAIDLVDSGTGHSALGFMVNCAYPSFLCADEQPGSVFERLIGVLANASALDHCDLDGAERLQAESVSEWGELMLQLHRAYGLRILGGCCGTGGQHLQYLVDKGPGKSGRQPSVSG
jgi:S-methylmethionine-dependent homocysteine/selenocysteine methylase